MAEKMQFDLVSPERNLASLSVDSVQIPGSEGDLTAMRDHAPLMTTLRPGLIVASNGAERTEYLVTGGFAEISPAGAIILAEQALPRAEVTAGVMDKALADAEEAHRLASDDTSTAAAKRVNDIKTLRGNLGL